MDSVELLVGRVGRAHGLRGETLIDVRTDDPDKRFAVGTEFSTARGQLQVARCAWHGRRFIVGFSGVENRTTAEALRGVELHVEVRTDERPDDPEEFYDHQLVGLVALGDDGRVLGNVVEVLHLPGQDLLVVGRVDLPDVLVPFVSELVPTVDLPSRQLVVRLQPGLVEAEAEPEPEPKATSDDPRGPSTSHDGS